VTAVANAFIWYELMTSDTEAARAFYSAVVGWQPQELAGPHSGYTIWNAAGRGVGGMMRIPDEAYEKGAKPGWVGYIAVSDTDAAAAGIEEAGGTILRAPAEIPEVGRFAVAADPGGASFMLLAPTPRGEPPQPAPRMTPGTVGWHELYAADGEAAFAFYAGRFGWSEVSTTDMGPMGTYRLWSDGGEEAIGGMMTAPPHAPEPGWRYYFVVEGIDAAAARIADHGGAVTHGPMEVPDGSWVVQGSDPQGAAFSLVSRTR
jgi:predicted enzyme related to lactoylglutathione lyase